MNSNDTLYNIVKAWFIKQYRYFFIPKIDHFPIPKGETLFEMDLITGNISKAIYKSHNGSRIFVRNENCIYQSADSLHEVKPKFKSIIDKSLKRN